MEERRQHSYIKGNDMDDLKDRLVRIEKQGTDASIATKVMEASFTTHIAQNEKDFKHVDDCLHRSDSESKSRDEEVSKQIEKMAEEVQELKSFMWRTSGALLVLVPLVNHLAGKYL